jgi:hypothetical protein
VRPNSAVAATLIDDAIETVITIASAQLATDVQHIKLADKRSPKVIAASRGILLLAEVLTQLVLYCLPAAYPPLTRALLSCVSRHRIGRK